MTVLVGRPSPTLDVSDARSGSPAGMAYFQPQRGINSIGPFGQVFKKKDATGKMRQHPPGRQPTVYQTVSQPRRPRRDRSRASLPITPMPRKGSLYDQTHHPLDWRQAPPG